MKYLLLYLLSVSKLVLKHTAYSQFRYIPFQSDLRIEQVSGRESGHSYRSNHHEHPSRRSCSARAEQRLARRKFPAYLPKYLCSICPYIQTCRGSFPNTKTENEGIPSLAGSSFQLPHCKLV
ncbi:hypothetical protein QBC45DRAFT_400258, partial [Copromyces sp. CBS 386.78]